MSKEQGGKLKVSKTEIELFLGPDSCASAEVKLQHTRGNKNIAFQVKGTHAHRYAVYPNKGVITPNSTITIQVRLNDAERQNLINLFEMLGRSGMDLDKDSLSIQYCILLESDSVGLDELNDDFWRGRTRENIDIDIRHTNASDLSSWPRFGASGFLAFPGTPTVRSCLDEINSRDNEKTCIHTLLVFLGIIIIILASYTLGTIGLIPGSYSLLKMHIQRREWVNRLESFRQNSIATQGRVLKRIRIVDAVLGKEHYFVQLQYAFTGADGNIQEYAVNFTSDVVTHNAKRLYELTEETSLVPMKVLPDSPKAAIPKFLLDEKLNVSRSYARYWHPIRATLGFMVYFGSILLWLFILPIQVVLCVILPVAVGGAAITVLIRLPIARKELELKQKLLQLEPASISTEKDVRQEFVNKVFGTRLTTRVKLVMAIVGGFVSLVQSPPGFFILAAYGILPSISLSTTHRRRKLLQNFEANKIIVNGNIFSHRKERGISSGDNDRYYGTIRYHMAIGDGTYTFEREFQSQKLYDQVGRRIEIEVHPRHPRSGHPHEIMKSMAQKDKVWYKVFMLLLILISVCAYLSIHQFIYHSGNSMPESLSSVITSWVVTCIAPILMMPQILVWSEKNFRNDKKNLFNGANVIKFNGRRGLRTLQTVHSVPKAVEVSTNETLVTGSTSEDSTIATITGASELDHFDNHNTNGENGREVSLEIV